MDCKKFNWCPVTPIAFARDAGKVAAGVWAFGLMIHTIALKIAIPIFRGSVGLYDPPSGR